MDDQIKEGIGLAAEISKQLITLSTGIVAITTTFAKDIVGNLGKGHRRLLVASWSAYLLAILFALWHLSALAGSLLVNATPVSIDSARTPAFLQITSFIIATAFIVIFAAAAARSRSSEGTISE